MKKLIRSFFVLSISQTLAKASGFLLLAILARQISVADYGIITLLISVASIVLVLADFGVDVYTVKELSQSDDQHQSLIFREGNTLRIAFTLVASIASFIFCWFYFEHFTDIVCGGGLVLAAALSSYARFLRQPFYVSSKAEYDALCIFIEKAVFFVVGCWLIYLGYGNYGYALASILASIIVVILSVSLARKHNGFVQGFNLGKRLLNFIKGSYPIGLNAIFVVLYLRLGAFFIEHYRSEDELGWYGVVGVTIFGFMTVTSSFTQIMFPTISRLVHRANLDMKKSASYLVLCLLAIAVPGLLLFSFGVNYFVEFVFGEKYAPSASVLSFQVFQVAFLLITPIFGSVLRASGRAMAMAMAALLGLLVNIALCLWLIHDYGMYGIAWACLITEAVVFLCACFLTMGRQGAALIVVVSASVFSTAVLRSGALAEYSFNISLAGVLLWVAILTMLYSGRKEFLAMIRSETL